MFKKIMLGLVIFFLAVGFMGTSESEDKITITIEEFNSIKVGDSFESAIDAIGGTGKVLSEGQYSTIMMMREGDTFLGNANIMFQQGKVMNKAQFGLE